MNGELLRIVHITPQQLSKIKLEIETRSLNPHKEYDTIGKLTFQNLIYIFNHSQLAIQ